MSQPRTCGTCAKPVAHKRAFYCFDCQPGEVCTPSPCRRCGSEFDYYSAGLCARCHSGAPRQPRSCRDCLACGTIRQTTGLCKDCARWRSLHPTVGLCRSCGDERHIGRGGVCRLCWRQSADFHRDRPVATRPYQPVDVIAANRMGQQLFFTGMAKRHEPRRSRRPPGPPTHPAGAGRQLSLFDVPAATWASRHGFPEPPTTARSAALEAAVVDHAHRHGWGPKPIKRARRAVRILAGRQRGPGQLILATDVVELAKLGFGARPVLAVLEEAGLLEDDRVPTMVNWFERQTAGLPPTMARELGIWLDVQLHGRTVPPRSRPRSVITIRVRANWALPTLRSWAAAGHMTLREISRADVIAALPPSGNPRATLGHALRSIFTILRANKVVFTNPTARIAVGAVERREPLPVDVETLRQLLGSTDPACAAIASLVAFHGLRPVELRQLQLIDVRDGRLHLAHRSIPLAAGARLRLTTWLDHRQSRWPTTPNPHLLIHRSTAAGLGPVGIHWVGRTLGMAPSLLTPTGYWMKPTPPAAMSVASPTCSA